jgi:hypothetical protein
MKYAMLLVGDESHWFDAPAERIEAAMDQINSWAEKWGKEGKLAGGGAELDQSTKAKTVSRGNDGQPVVTDGPYLELKEVIGGFILLDAENIEEAVAVAATWPGIAEFGDRVEVRPVIER